MLRVITPAAAEPISLVEAKAHLDVSYSDKDDLITALIASATLHLQAVTQRLFITQTVELILPCWPAAIRLPVAPVRASDGVVSVKYVDAADALQTLSSSSYVVRQDGPTACILPKWGTAWPSLSTTPAAEPVVVRFAAGQAAADVPANVKAALKLLVRHLFDNPSAVNVGAAPFVMPMAVEALMASEIWV